MSSAQEAGSGLPEPPGPLSVLRYRDFRLLWSGQVVSMIGSRMQGAAILWQLYDVTHSATALGLMGLARFVPVVLFALVGGVTADALDRRRLLIFSQTILALIAAGLGIWSLRGAHEAWPIYLASALNAGVIAFDGPARQSIVPALVPRDRLAHALSLNSLSSQLAQIVGPTLMGLVIARMNIGVVYLLNGASFIAVIGALIAMRSVGRDEGTPRPQISLGAALEGLHFMLRARLLLSLMVLDFLATFFSSATTLLPIYARDILHVGATGYGWLVGAPAIGALLTAAVIATAPTIQRQGMTVLVAVFLYGAATVVFGLGHSFWLCFLGLAGTGAADTVSTVLRQTIRQLVTPDALRGRMTAINMVFFQGGPQLGELEAGLLANWLGAPFSVISGGVACMVTVALVGARSPWLRGYQHGDELSAVDAG